MGMRQPDCQRCERGPHSPWLRRRPVGVLEAIRHRVELHELAPAQHKAVLDVALETGLPVYDAAYLWLARSLKLPLATFDEAQARAARKSGVALLDLTEL